MAKKIKVLWLSGNPSLYKRKSMIDGGWIGTLQGEIVKREIDLAIAFPYGRNEMPSSRDGVRYYPLYVSKLTRKINRFTQNRIDRIYIHKLLQIVDDLKPDIIHCWGSELYLGLIAKYVQVPVILHIQGLLNPYYNAFLPVGMSWFSVLRALNYNIFKFHKYFGWYSKMPLLTKREKEILRNTKYFFGRTDWDKHVTRLISPHSTYFFCSEALRPAIIESKKWTSKIGKRKIIISTTISSPLYKGADVILRTAKLLKEITTLDFEWNIYGINDMKIFERFIGVKAHDMNIRCRGIVTANELAEKLRVSDVYVHPSYIENSPNSVCEAQYIGIPVIATNVGGVSTLLENGAGILVPANDAYQTAYFIQKICDDNEFAEELSQKSIEVAEKRHDINVIIDTIMNVYNKILRTENG